MKRQKKLAVGKVLLENDITRITEWSFSGYGDNTGWHEHGCDYCSHTYVFGHTGN